jgi:hypothetical protein
MGLNITPSLKNALARLYYLEGCDQHGWASVSLGDISIKDNVTVFSKGSRRLRIRLMDRIVPEVMEISEPLNGKFVFDYLACKIGQPNRDDVLLANPEALCWVKLGRGIFSDDQVEALGRIKLPLALFRIRNVLAPPAAIEMKWEIKTGKEWLDDIDDLRDQAESDDDYF